MVTFKAISKSRRRKYKKVNNESFDEENHEKKNINKKQQAYLFEERFESFKKVFYCITSGICFVTLVMSLSHINIMNRSAVVVTEPLCVDDLQWLNSKYGDGSLGCLHYSEHIECSGKSESQIEMQKHCRKTCGLCKITLTSATPAMSISSSASPSFVSSADLSTSSISSILSSHISLGTISSSVSPISPITQILTSASIEHKMEEYDPNEEIKISSENKSSDKVQAKEIETSDIENMKNLLKQDKRYEPLLIKFNEMQEKLDAITNDLNEKNIINTQPIDGPNIMKVTLSPGNPGLLFSDKKLGILEGVGQDAQPSLERHRHIIRFGSELININGITYSPEILEKHIQGEEEYQLSIKLAPVEQIKEAEDVLDEALKNTNDKQCLIYDTHKNPQKIHHTCYHENEFPIKEISVEECRDLCEERPRCTLADWYDTQTCFLYTAEHTKTCCPGCINYGAHWISCKDIAVIRWQYEKIETGWCTNESGQNIRYPILPKEFMKTETTEIFSAPLCINWCDQTPNCKGYVTEIGKSCFLIFDTDINYDTGIKNADGKERFACWRKSYKQQ